MFQSVHTAGIEGHFLQGPTREDKWAHNAGWSQANSSTFPFKPVAQMSTFMSQTQNHKAAERMGNNSREYFYVC